MQPSRESFVGGKAHSSAVCAVGPASRLIVCRQSDRDLAAPGSAVVAPGVRAADAVWTGPAAVDLVEF